MKSLRNCNKQSSVIHMQCTVLGLGVNSTMLRKTSFFSIALCFCVNAPNFIDPFYY